MSSELQVVAQGDSLTAYAVVRRISDAYVWQTTTSTFVAWVDGNVANYDVALTSKGGDLYQGDFPTGVANGTKVRVNYYSRAGASPAITDLLIKSIDYVWNGVLTETAGTVGASACSLVSLSAAKRHLEITDSTKDDLIQQLINQSAALFLTAADRDICAADYIEFVRSNGATTLVLKQFPVIRVNRVATGRANALAVSYGGTAIRAMLSVNDLGVRLMTTTAAGVTTNTDLTFAACPTLSTMATSISAVTDWTATASQDGLSSNLYRQSGYNAKARTVNVEWPYYDLQNYEVNDDAATVRIRHNSFPYGYQGGGCGFMAMIEYRAGYESIPEDIQGVIVDMVSAALSTTGDASSSSTGTGSRAITSESLGDYSRSLEASSTTNQATSTLAMKRILGENVAIIEKYRNVAVAEVV